MHRLFGRMLHRMLAWSSRTDALLREDIEVRPSAGGALLPQKLRTAALESLDEFDQRPLLAITEPRLLRELTRAEIVPSINDEVRTFAQF